MVRAWCVLTILTPKSASRAGGVPFFQLASFKSGPSMVCFDDLGVQMRFVCRRVPIFQLASSKSDPSMVCFDDLTSKCALRAGGVPFFQVASLHLPKVLRPCNAFTIFDFQMRFPRRPRAIFCQIFGQRSPHPLL